MWPLGSHLTCRWYRTTETIASARSPSRAVLCVGRAGAGHAGRLAVACPFDLRVLASVGQSACRCRLGCPPERATFGDFCVRWPSGLVRRDGEVEFGMVFPEGWVVARSVFSDDSLTMRKAAHGSATVRGPLGLSKKEVQVRGLVRKSPFRFPYTPGPPCARRPSPALVADQFCMLNVCCSTSGYMASSVPSRSS